MRPPASTLAGAGTRLPSTLLLGLLLTLVLLLPSLPLYLGLASSMTLGACAAACAVIFAAFILRVASPAADQEHGLSFGAATFLILAIGVFHLAIATLIGPIDLVRATLSFVPAVLILWSGHGLGRLLCASRGVAVERSVQVCLGLMFALGLLAIGGYVPPASSDYFKPVFPYTEPSHFALAFLPLLMFGCVRLEGNARFALLLGGLALGWALESLTLMAGWFLVALLCLRMRSIVLVLAVLALLALQLDLSYYLDRLDFAGGGQNISTLVYLQGWQLIDESLRQSAGWGLGFQQLGVQGSSVDASDLIFALIGNNANLLDGGFAFAKLASEFGVMSVPLMWLYATLAWRSARALRQASRNPRKNAPTRMLAQSVVVCFLVELFVRGEGYFSGTTLLLAAAITILSMQPTAQAEDVGAQKQGPGPRVRRRALIGDANDLAAAGRPT